MLLFVISLAGALEKIEIIKCIKIVVVRGKGICNIPN
jgi:hypothetical protein